MKIEFVPVDLVDDYEKNSNIHPPEQIQQIKALMLYVGWTNIPLVYRVDGRYGLISGHGRKEAAIEIYGESKSIQMADKTPIPANTMPVVFADGWSPEQITAYVMADNQTAKNSRNDEKVLAEELASLREVDFDLDLIGFDDEELNDLLNSLDSGDGSSGSNDDGDRAGLLEMVNTTIGEPKNQFDSKTIYRMGKHFIFTFSPINDWSVWVPYLEEGDLFCPFPGPYIALTEKAETTRLIDNGIQPQIETSGTSEIRAHEKTWVTVSPKIDMPGGKVVLDSAIQRANEIKMPVGRQRDIDRLLELPIENKMVYLQPLSLSDKATKLCIDTALQYGFRLSIQWHKYINIR